MRYMLVVMGLIAIGLGVIRGVRGGDEVTTAVLVVSGVVMLATGVAACEVIAAIRGGRAEGEERQRESDAELDY
jgi:hypothetical protein